MTTELTVFQSPIPTPEVWKMISEIAVALHESRRFELASPAQGKAVMLKGFELGIPFTASFDLIRVIEGRLKLIPRGAMALLHKSPLMKSIKVFRLVNGTQYMGHECTIERKNGFIYTVRWTLDDAKRAQLVKPNGGWDKYPENMCQWRCIGFCSDVAASDVLMGNTDLMTRPEAFGVGLTAEGDVIDAPVVEVVTLEFLLEKYGVQSVIDANYGNIPDSTNAAQVAEIARVLGSK